MSMKAIAREVGASLSSVSRWVRDIPLTDEQQATLELQAFNGHVNGRAVNSAIRRGARMIAQEEGRQLAQRREALHVAGCMLYWAEGAKDRNQIRFTNSDPEMARFFVGFLRTYFSSHGGQHQDHLQPLRGPRRPPTRDRAILARHA
jgi:hypothetical protein